MGPKRPYREVAQEWHRGYDEREAKRREDEEEKRQQEKEEREERANLAALRANEEDEALREAATNAKYIKLDDGTPSEQLGTEHVVVLVIQRLSDDVEGLLQLLHEAGFLPRFIELSREFCTVAENASLPPDAAAKTHVPWHLQHIKMNGDYLGLYTLYASTLCHGWLTNITKEKWDAGCAEAGFNLVFKPVANVGNGVNKTMMQSIAADPTLLTNRHLDCPALGTRWEYTLNCEQGCPGIMLTKPEGHNVRGFRVPGITKNRECVYLVIPVVMRGLVIPATPKSGPKTASVIVGPSLHPSVELE